jgi:hypothetical protein
MAKNSSLSQYCLKASPDLFDEIDKQRMLLVGIANPQGVSRADYIRDAIVAYNEYHSKVVESKAQRLRELNDEYDEPVSFYYDNGTDVRWT